MKSLFLFSVLSVVIMLSACSKPSKEEQCKKAMDHFVAIALADASMKDLPQEAKDSFKTGIMGTEVQKCVAEYSETALSCFTKATTLAEIGNCK